MRRTALQWTANWAIALAVACGVKALSHGAPAVGNVGDGAAAVRAAAADVLADDAAADVMPNDAARDPDQPATREAASRADDSPAAASEPEPAQGTAEPAAETSLTPTMSAADAAKLAASLVEQLNARDFAQREQATQRLIGLGPAARKAVEAGCSHADAEVRFRCRYVLSAIAYHERWGRVDAFANDLDGKLGLTLPGWDRFRTMMGDDREARSLFVEMQRAEADLLELVEKNPAAAAKACAERCMFIQQTMHFNRDAAQLGTIAALLFLAADQRLNLDDQVGVQLYSLCNHVVFQTAIENSTRKDKMRKLLGQFVSQGSGRNTAYYRLMLAMRYNLPEGVEPARNLLEDKGSPQHYKQYAALTIAKLGKEEHVPLLERCLDDKTVCSAYSTNENGKQVNYQTQLRDVALACIIHLRGEDPKEFGFERVQRQDQFLFNVATLGFTDDAKREAAHAKWRERAAKAVEEPAADTAEGAAGS